MKVYIKNINNKLSEKAKLLSCWAEAGPGLKIIKCSSSGGVNIDKSYLADIMSTLLGSTTPSTNYSKRESNCSLD